MGGAVEDRDLQLEAILGRRVLAGVLRLGDDDLRVVEVRLRAGHDRAAFGRQGPCGSDTVDGLVVQEMFHLSPVDLLELDIDAEFFAEASREVRGKTGPLPFIVEFRQGRRVDDTDDEFALVFDIFDVRRNIAVTSAERQHTDEQNGGQQDGKIIFHNMTLLTGSNLAISPDRTGRRSAAGSC